MKDREYKLVFIGGAPRSGTSLVQKILDCNSKVYGGPEFDDIPHIVRLHNIISDIPEKRKDIYFDQKELKVLFREFMVGLLSNRLTDDIEVISEKTPSNCFVFEELSEIFPDSKLIFVFRDPRAVVSSLLDVGLRAKSKRIIVPWISKSFSNALFTVISYHKRASLNIKKIPELVYQVNYNSFILEPDKSIRQLCEYIGVEPEIEMFNPEKNTSFHKVADNPFYTQEMQNSKIHNDSLYKYNQKLNWYQKRIINYAMSKHKKEYLILGFSEFAATEIFDPLLVLFFAPRYLLYILYDKLKRRFRKNSVI